MSIRSDYSENDFIRSLSEQPLRGVSYLRDLPGKLALKAEEISAGNQDGFIQNETFPFSSTFLNSGFSQLFGSHEIATSNSNNSSVNYFLPLFLLGGIGLGLTLGISNLFSLASKQAFRSFIPKLAVGLGFGGLFAACNSGKQKLDANDFRKGKNIQKFGIESYQSPPISNWSGEVAFTPDIAFCPKNLNEIITIVKNAEAENKQICMRGEGHSWSPLVLGEYLISTINFKKIIKVDPQKQLITVEPGATIAEVENELEKYNLMIPCNVVGTEKITIGGIMATGSHGSGRRCSPVSDTVVEIEMVLPNGEVKTFSDESDPETMNALRLNLGMFGVMSKITFKVEPTFNVEVVDQQFPLKELFNSDRLPTILRRFETVEVLWFPGTENVIVKSWNRTSKPIPTTPTQEDLQAIKDRENSLKAFDTIISPLLVVSPDIALSLIRQYSPDVFKTRTYLTTGRKAIHYIDATAFPIREMEIAVPFNGPDDLQNVQRAWNAMLIHPSPDQKTGIRGPDIIAHVRFSSGSKVPMSPAYGNKQTAWLDFGSYYKIPEKDWAALNNKIWKETWENIEGRKLHLAKGWPSNIQVDVRKMYGEKNYDEYVKIRSRLDPKGRFVNPKMKERFGLQFVK